LQYTKIATIQTTKQEYDLTFVDAVIVGRLWSRDFIRTVNSNWDVCEGLAEVL
jgi:hypothetical protein